MPLRFLFASLSRILIAVGLSFILPLLCSLYYGDGQWVTFAYSIFITITFSLLLYFFFPLENYNIRHVDGYFIVTLVWIVVALFGTLPFIISGTMNFTNALFESMSGFTTAGASILKDVEAMPKSLIMWRSMTHWLGGMGIVVLFVALIAQYGPSANKIFGAEAPGPVVEKITPRISETARELWKYYVILTLIQIVLLIVAGMDIFDSIAHSFGAIATGGFATKNNSIGFYLDNNLIQLILTIFMFLGGANFALYYLFWKKKSVKVFLHNEEFKLYVFIVSLASLLITINLYFANLENQGFLPLTALFQVVSVITTTGYATVDYNTWPSLAKTIMFMLLFIGGSTGSTAGGIKVGRFLILIKSSLSELLRFSHPRVIRGIKINKHPVDDKIIIGTFVFFFVYMAIIGLGTLVMSAFNLDIISSLTATLACLGVVGPGLGVVGPAANYGDIHPLGKYFLTLLMLVGRLELFTILVLFNPQNWK